MASPGSELEKILAKRRSLKEQAFESSAALPPAQVRGAPSSAVVADVATELPSWMSFAQDQGIVFIDPITNADSGNPPWLDAAVESGVVFYDPDGDEVVVPSSKVGAFKAGLENVRDFEYSWSGHVDREQRHLSGSTEQQELRSSTADASGDGVPADAAPEIAAAPDASVTNAGRAATSLVNAPASADQDPCEAVQETQRQNLKCVVQKRYFALLREGVEPNEAAAWAILEAKGLPAQSEEHTQGRGAALAAAAEGQAPESSSRGSSASRRSCASSARDGAKDGERKEVVAA